MPQTDCRFFNGYKPCGKNEICDELCPSRSIPSAHLLLIHLDAMGAVLRSTSLIAAIRRKFPNCHLTWVTAPAAAPLLEHNPRIDRLLTNSHHDLLKLSALQFDVAFVVDKSLAAAGVLAQTKVDQVYGFVVDPSSSAIVPATPAANELWEIGLSNKKKFLENQKPETRLMHESLELGTYLRDEYDFHFSPSELEQVAARRNAWRLRDTPIVGINTGCSAIMPHKKLTVEFHRQLIQELQHQGFARVVLLGGPEDTERNQQIAYGLNVIESPTHSGIRDGMMSVAACDIVVTGDSLGMHMAIAQKKWVVAWFGPTCAQEIDLYDRGVKVKSYASCGPCWKRTCQKNPMCYDLVSLAELVEGVRQGLRWNQTSQRISSSKQPLSEISFSPSR